MEHTSYIELSKKALKNNIEFIKKELGQTKLSAVIKGNAYGHGYKEYAPLLYDFGVRHLSVFSADEAFDVLNVLPDNITLLILGYIDDVQLEWVIQQGIEFYVFDIERLDKAIQMAKKLNKKAKIHIELETGMNRTGFDSRELTTIISKIESELLFIELKGVCSHLAGAESIANYKRISDQITNFKKFIPLVDSIKNSATDFHLACSAASIQYPETKLDLARIGILQYGFFPSNEVLVQYLAKKNSTVNPLQRVISWKTKVMDLKTVKRGEFIGYGTSYFTNRNTVIALIPVGYSHGFSRSLSNQGKVLIRGKRFDVIGIVNMNMMAVDVTENSAIEKGDEVVLIGQQGSQEISVSSFSDFSDQVNYELLTRLPSKITRLIKE
ncbi:alanine racemase [Crocinitomix algicola]|uniref:alanine racemase n=1 Tax=Crocinitomix algicola TaxID=1740263 RepID=UPI0008721F1F|nr:alanine racemase [Crocinitomix algicola]